VKVYMAPCGLGLGHITRSDPIARELARRGVEVVFSTYGDGIDYARKMKLRLMETVPIYIWVKQDGTVDFKSIATRSGLSLGVRTFLRQVLAEIRNIKRFKPDLVFSDSRASTLVAARLLGVPTILMLNQYRVNMIRKPSSTSLSISDHIFFLIANLAWIFFRTLLQGLWSLSDIILIPDFPPPYTVSLGNLAIPKRHIRKVRLVGPVVKTKPSQISYTLDKIRRRLGLVDSKPLVYVAVSGPQIERRYLAHILEDSITNYTLDCQVVMSKGEPSGSEEAERRGNILAFDWLQERSQYEVLKACDLVVSRAGHGIIMKAMTFGKPMILIPIPDHTEQYGNAKRAVLLGFAKILDQDKVNPDNLMEIMNQVLESEELRETAGQISGFSERLDTVNDITRLILSQIRQEVRTTLSTVIGD